MYGSFIDKICSASFPIISNRYSRLKNRLTYIFLNRYHMDKPVVNKAVKLDQINDLALLIVSFQKQKIEEPPGRPISHLGIKSLHGVSDKSTKV